ncbi:hypothetical protein KFL_006270060 [Klebsormidium nitens]|uniref:BTB domain-containing protein n=1 Tax=Klebsormidium nitens TaxID=105231 RepID=A0A1Y1IHP0_KLENI|nr:hypothetical protein KFL_006270060 [Klebsormidium nitens]|eukprot:GAQ90324.1 hypothetical protein KFL_006270060 [Klebsormidium nitens]
MSIVKVYRTQAVGRVPLNATVQDGSTSAHASVLKDSASYFQPLLSERWSGDISSEKRLKLPLPVPANVEMVKAFLNCLYGVPVVLQALEWRGTSLQLFENVYQLADACGARKVCFQIVVCVELTEKNIAWWIEWLKWEHVPDEDQALKPGVSTFLQKYFATRWDCYEPDRLPAFWKLDQRDSVAGKG